MYKRLLSLSLPQSIPDKREMSTWNRANTHPHMHSPHFVYSDDLPGLEKLKPRFSPIILEKKENLAEYDVPWTSNKSFAFLFGHSRLSDGEWQAKFKEYWKMPHMPMPKSKRNVSDLSSGHCVENMVIFLEIQKWLWWANIIRCQGKGASRSCPLIWTAWLMLIQSWWFASDELLAKREIRSYLGFAICLFVCFTYTHSLVTTI